MYKAKIFDYRIKRYQRKQGAICYILIRLEVPEKRIVETWYVISGGGFATAPKINEIHTVDGMQGANIRNCRLNRVNSKYV